MGKQGESGENIEKHWKTGRIRGKYRKTLKNRAIRGKHGKTGRIRENRKR